MTAITTPTQVRFGDLVKTESRKYVNTRATPVPSIFIAVVPAVITIGVIATCPDLAKITTGTDLQFLLLSVTLILTVVIVILSVTSKWTQREALATFVVEPRRERVATAKALVILGVVLTIWLIIRLSWAVFNAAGAATRGLEASWGFHWIRWFKIIKILLLDATMTFTLTLLLCNTALAVTIFVVDPVTVGALSRFGELTAKITAWIRTPGTSLQTILSIQKDGQTPDIAPWDQFTVGVIIWIVVPLVIGLWLNCHADTN